jgi:Novel STAND NTPase 1
MSAAPFRGLEPFRRIDEQIFCERDRETMRLIQLIALYRGVLLYGESGAGKSSLVNAGLVPRAADERWYPVRLRYQPIRGRELMMESLADVPLKGSTIFAQNGQALISVAALGAELQADNGFLSEDDRALLLIFDQFEEIITLTAEAAERSGNAQSAREAQENVKQFLVDVLRSSHMPVKVLFAFREDYLAKIGRLLAEVPNVMDQYMRLEPVRTTNVEHIISGPFRTATFERPFSPELVKELTTAFTERYERGFLELSAVQVVCLQLWSMKDVDARSTRLRTLTIDSIVEDFLAASILRLNPDLRDAAVVMLCDMVTSTGTRNVISLPALLSTAAKEQVNEQTATRALAALQNDAKVITRDARRDIVFFEIISEFLVPWIMRQKDRRKEREYQRRRRKSLAAMALIAIALLVPAWAILWTTNLHVKLDKALDERLRQQLSQTSTAFLELQKEKIENRALVIQLEKAVERAEHLEQELRTLRTEQPKEEK